MAQRPAARRNPPLDAATDWIASLNDDPVTVTFHAAMPGLWIHPGKEHAGDVRVVEIDVNSSAYNAGHIEGALSIPFLKRSRGKRSVAIDLKTSEGMAILHSLVDGADIFLGLSAARVLKPEWLPAMAKSP